MSAWQGIRHRGVQTAIAASVLFGVATPLAKLLLGTVSPWLLAALLYLGSGVGLSVYRVARRAPRVRMARSDIPWFAAAILAGGVIGPVLLMVGLTGLPASGASLLMNAEGVLTALLAWVVFHENVDRRVGLGMAAILAGAIVLSWPGSVDVGQLWPTVAVLAACLAWAIDNNLTRKVSLTDATWLAAVKGLTAGTVNLVIALLLGATWPSPFATSAAGLLGFLSYGVSLALFVVALRQLGTARAGAYFSLAPFIGAVLAVLLGDPITPQLAVAGLLMAIGVWLHLSERHEHEHTHTPVEHTHPVDADAHHDAVQWTTHDASPTHQHAPITHSHPHYPDAHHRHRHT